MSRDVERVARAVMVARSGRCLVKDWDVERRDNPNVEEAWNIAQAAMRETRLIDAEALRITALGRGIPDNPEQIINDLADWLKGRADAE